MKHQILGAGAVGHLVAGMLTRASILSEFILQPIQKSSLASHYIFSDKVSSNQMVRNLSAHADLTKIEVLWVCVKSYQLKSALTSIKHKCSAETNIVLMQNGMGNLEIAIEVLGDVVAENQLFVVSNTHGAYLELRPNNAVIHHTGIGQMKLGGNFLGSGVEKPIFLDSLPTTMNISWHKDIESELWLKLGINAVINPLTAIYQCRNGELARNQHYKNIVDKLLSELIVFYKHINRQHIADLITKRCYEVIHNTSDNYSSMLRDVQAGRKTEIHAITGYLLNAAYETKLVLAEHKSLYHRLQNT